jgi:hypothetical protein
MMPDGRKFAQSGHPERHKETVERRPEMRGEGWGSCEADISSEERLPSACLGESGGASDAIQGGGGQGWGG